MVELQTQPNVSLVKYNSFSYKLVCNFKIINYYFFDKNKMIKMSQITNEMLYDLLKEFKWDVNKQFIWVDKRFEQVDKRFEQIDKRFEQIHEEIYDLKQDRREDRQILMKVFESRDKVIAKITWDFIWKAAAVNAGILALMIWFIKDFTS